MTQPRHRRWHLVLLGALLLPYLELLVRYWVSGPNYAMASLLAVVAAVIVAARERHSAPVGNDGERWWIVLPAAVLTILYVVSLTLLLKKGLAGIAAAALIAVCCHYRHGSGAVWHFRYALLLLVCAAPVPAALSDLSTTWLVQLVVTTSSTAIGWFVAGVQQNGTLIQLPQHGAVEVISDCSGLDGVVLFVPLAITLLYFHPRLTWFSKLLVLAMAIPLALFGNFLRVFVTGLLQAKDIRITYSPTFHEWLGIGTLGTALVALLVLPRLLWQTPIRPTRNLESAPT